MDSPKTRHARWLFAGIAPEYDRMAALLSFGQDARWRRFMVSRVNAIPGSWVLDVATGTGLVARELTLRRNVRVAGLDHSEPMVRRGHLAVREAGIEDRVVFVLGRAERLPFPDEAFDAVTFTYLLRYVDDPAATLIELSRVLRPGGVLACLEFHVPEGRVMRPAWLAYTRLVMPVAGWLVSRAWYRTGRFLGGSISGFYDRYPLAEQVRMWQAAGLRRIRTGIMSLGGGIVIWGMKGNG
jgi:demethylmenaquinone methyltransferase/2-methoxy-6-polyprenyl-1,4-benzoquinol methylase